MHTIPCAADPIAKMQKNNCFSNIVGKPNQGFFLLGIESLEYELQNVFECKWMKTELLLHVFCVHNIIAKKKFS